MKRFFCTTLENTITTFGNNYNPMFSFMDNYIATLLITIQLHKCTTLLFNICITVQYFIVLGVLVSDTEHDLVILSIFFLVNSSLG